MLTWCYCATIAGLDIAELQAEAAAAAKLAKQEEKERLRAQLDTKRAELELAMKAAQRARGGSGRCGGKEQNTSFGSDDDNGDAVAKKRRLLDAELDSLSA